MFCKNCGKPLSENSTFCSHCGIKITENALPSTDSQNLTCDSTIINSEFPASENESSPLPYFLKNTSPNLKSLIIIAITIVSLIILVQAVLSWLQSPNRVSEEGTHNIELGNSITLSSIDATITFEDAVIGEIDFDKKTGTIDYMLRINFSDLRDLDPYCTWLSNFDVNGIQAKYEPGIMFGGNFIGITPDSIYTDSKNNYIKYKVSYSANFDTEDQFILTCKISQNLILIFNITREQLLAYNQNVIDKSYGIELVNWSNNANDLSYSENSLYRMTGTVLSSGNYFSEETYYITLDAVHAFPGYDVHCYLSKEEWLNAPNFSSGDTITIYGQFDFKTFGWNFDNCTFTSPANLFKNTIDSSTQTDNNKKMQSTDLASYDFSWIEGEYHQAHYYPLQMDLWFETNSPWLNSSNWSINVFLTDDGEFLAEATLYYSGGNEMPVLKGEIPGSEIILEYDGYNFIVNCPALNIYDASFF